MHILLEKNNPAKFHRGLIGNDGALGIFEEVAPTRTKKNKMSSDMGSVPDQKMVYVANVCGTFLHDYCYAVAENETYRRAKCKTCFHVFIVKRKFNSHLSPLKPCFIYHFKRNVISPSCFLGASIKYPCEN